MIIFCKVEKAEYEEPIIRIVDTEDDVIATSNGKWSGEWDYEF